VMSRLTREMVNKFFDEAKGTDGKNLKNSLFRKEAANLQIALSAAIP
jgi:hypothetical protein